MHVFTAHPLGNTALGYGLAVAATSKFGSAQQLYSGPITFAIIGICRVGIVHGICVWFVCCPFWIYDRASVRYVLLLQYAEHNRRRNDVCGTSLAVRCTDRIDVTAYDWTRSHHKRADRRDDERFGPAFDSQYLQLGVVRDREVRSRSTRGEF